jgi:hypothetical protein
VEDAFDLTSSICEPVKESVDLFRAGADDTDEEDGSEKQPQAAKSVLVAGLVILALTHVHGDTHCGFELKLAPRRRMPFLMSTTGRQRLEPGTLVT